MTSYARRVAVLTDTRFPGGTSSAIAQELLTTRSWGLEEIYSPPTSMLKKHPRHAGLEKAARSLGIKIVNDFKSIVADTVILHNPAFLKFEEALDFRIICNRLVIINHENPMNGVGVWQYPFHKIMGLIEEATFANEILLAPISPVNRDIMERSEPPFPLTEGDWFNIVDLECREPTAPVSDRRGRHSRPGPEKWPKKSELLQCFPHHAENHILGADWIRHACPTIAGSASLYDYGSVRVDDFLDRIDFFIYFHSKAWRETFGRVVAEAIAAGKLVIGQDYLEKTFPGGGIFCDVSEIREKILSYLDAPDRFRSDVAAAQNTLTRFSRSRFDAIWQEALQI